MKKIITITISSMLLLSLLLFTPFTLERNNNSPVKVSIDQHHAEAKGKKPGKKPSPGKKKKQAPTVPYKLNGGTNKSSFINKHAYDRHKYNKNEKSTGSKTQYGKDVDVKKLREITMNDYDNKWSTTDKSGTKVTYYAKQFSSNISTNDTKTTHHRVIINHKDSSKSTQFPLSGKK